MAVEGIEVISNCIYPVEWKTDAATTTATTIPQVSKPQVISISCIHQTARNLVELMDVS
jgi:hypothetical protein